MPPDYFDPIAESLELIARGAFDEAVEMLEAMLRENRAGILTRVQLGRAYLAKGDIASALECLREAVSLAPSVPEAALALGEALMAAGHLPVAIGEFQRALRLQPGWDAAAFRLGAAWLEAGEAARAKECLSQLPPSAERDALLNEVEKIAGQSRSPAGYVRHLFDQFAPDYETRMIEQLSYRAHLILRELADLVLAGRAGLSILDLGCGTGLAGQCFAPLAAGGRLDGVDLSPAMLARAQERGIYQNLIQADLETALAAEGPSYDLMIAADTFVYLGDLEPVLSLSEKRLKPDGMILFTVEAAAGEGFDLGPKRRYRHSEPYLRACAECCGLNVSGLIQCMPRREAQMPVDGFAVALQKSAI